MRVTAKFGDRQMRIARGAAVGQYVGISKQIETMACSQG